jgi:hypothetical protein
MRLRVAVTPDARVTWAHDVWGNAVATTAFQTMHETMVLDSVAQIDLDTADWPICDTPLRRSARQAGSVVADVEAARTAAGLDSTRGYSFARGNKMGRFGVDVSGRCPIRLSPTPPASRRSFHAHRPNRASR